MYNSDAVDNISHVSETPPRTLSMSSTLMTIDVTPRSTPCSLRSTTSTPLSTNNGTASDITVSAAELRFIIKSHALGDALLTATHLNTALRKLLVDILANHIVVQYTRPSKAVYMAFSKAIVELYQHESEATYYIPSANQSTPYGKLYFKAVNILNKRKQLGVPSGKTTRRKRNSLHYDLSNLENIPEETDAAITAMTSWLLIHQQPQSKLMEYWRKTARNRLTYIHEQDDLGPQLTCVLDEWKRYKDAEGYLLIASDFESLQPTKSDQMALNWPIVYTKILDKLRKSTVKDKKLSKLWSQIKVDKANPFTSEMEMKMALMFLPLLLPESAIVLPCEKQGKSRKRKVWKPTVVESLEYFIDVQESCIDMNEHLKLKADFMVSKHLKFQPHVVMLLHGCSETDLFTSTCVYYACINSSTYYETTSLLEAVDVCFKSTFVFSLEFSPASKSSWTYLQRAVYDITTDYDLIGSKVLELITDTLH